VTEIFGRSYLLRIALNWALIPAVNFLIYFFWVFRVGLRRPPPAGILRDGAKHLLGMRYFVDRIKKKPRPKQATKRLFRRTPTIADGFVKVGEVAEFGSAGQFSRWVGNHDILVFRHNGTIRGLSNICPHFGGPVGYYQLRDGRFTCLWHNLQFDADSGRCVAFPKLRLREYKIEVREGVIYAQLVEAEPASAAEAAAMPANQ
jgi:nitrite reductase/ring-hydroxylating ferredoxin subunit